MKHSMDMAVKFLTAGVGLILGLSNAVANPTGGKVVSGSAGIAGVGTGAVTVSQASNLAIINWQTFSINSGESTTFLQPSATSATLNRVLGGQTSLINGTLTANGSIYLINGNGIVVGPGGVITANAFTASTRDISNSDFLNGNLQFTGSNNAGVQNFGTINALGGNVVLIGKTVDNEGTINARKGTAGLVAADSVLLAQKNADGSTITVNPDPLATSALSQVGVKNGGTISAAAAELKAANGNVYALAIQNSGTIRATTAKRQGGHIWLTSDSGTIVNSGTLTASATVAKGQGGSIVVKSTTGSVSDTGAIVAQGGQGGVGGNVDLSGLTLQFSGTVNLTASGGTLGNLLLDPTDMDIVTGGGSSLTGSTVDPSAIVAALNLANVTLQADNSITVTNAINASGNTNAGNLILDTLTLNLNAGITLKSGSTLSGTATTVNVGTGGLVQNGVDAAASGATVNLAATTYDLTGEIVIDKNLTLNGSATGSTILNGQGDTRVMEIDGTATGDTINLTGLTLENGNGVDTTGVGAAGSSYVNDGGGLLIYTAVGSTANVTISRSSVLNNAVVGSFAPSFNAGNAGYGGGIDNADSATVTINTSTISGNSATGGFATNNLGGAGGGGGIENSGSGTMTINSSTISGNSVTGGGATFYGSNGYGGGIDNSGSGTVRINTSTLSGNSAASGSGFFTGGISSGGAINNDSSGTVVISNSTLSGNSAAGGGTTFYNPIAGGGGAIANSGKLTISDTILAGNTVGGAESDYYDNSGDSSGIVSDNGYNLFGTGGGYTGSATGDINYAGLITSVLDTTLANNGGPTETLALVNGSVAIGAGGANIGELELDQRGLARPETTISIGAYEYNERGNPFIITSIADNAVSGIIYLGQLRTALAYANANPFFDPTITFDAGVFTGGSANVIALTQGELLINSSLTIDASAVDGVTLNANNTSRVMEIDGTAAGDTISLSKLTLTGGNGIDTASAGAAGSTHANEGGALLLYSGAGDSVTVTINSSTITRDSATGTTSPAIGTGAFGGGIYDTASGTLTINSSTISGNSVTGGNATDGGDFSSSGGSAYGGGIENAATGTVVINASTVSGNSATGGGVSVGEGSGTGIGGGIENASSGTVAITNSTITGNSASAGSTSDGVSANAFGGGIGNLGSGTVTIASSTITGNSANGSPFGNVPSHGYGGGIYNTGTLTIGDTILAGNAATGASAGESDYATGGTPTLNDDGHNLYGQNGNAGGFTGTGTGDIELSSAIDTVLAPLANNGGPTETMALVVGSVAIDAGGAATPGETDQRGVLRGDGGLTGDAVDIGAYEAIVFDVTADDKAYTYGGTPPTLTYTVTNANSADEGEIAEYLSGSPTILVNKIDAGAYPGDIGQGSLAASGGAVLDFTAGKLTINPETLDVTLSNQTITYGGAITQGTPQYQLTTGQLYNGDTLTIGTHDSTSTGGYYNANGSGGSALTAQVTNSGNAGNYTIVVTTGANTDTLFVNPLTISASLSGSATKTYDGTTAVTNTSGLTVGLSDVLTGDVVTVTAGGYAYNNANVGNPVGVTASGLTLFGTDAGNYTLSTTSVNNTNIGAINPATLTYTATAANQTYGSSNTSFTGTVTGFVDGQNQETATTGTASFTSTTNAESNVGSYAIDGSGLTANNGNYTFVQAVGNAIALTINPATLTYTATAANQTYGSSNTSFTGTVTGFVNGQNQETATTGTVSFTSTTSAESNVGSYAIDGSGLTANNGNYTFVQAAGNATALTINPATLTYTATAANQIYGSSNTSFTGTVTGFVNGQNQETATTGTVSFTSTTSAESNVGSYAIDGSGLTANNGNYTFVQAAGNAIALTINPATLTYTATAANQTYGSSNTSFTGTVTGFVNGQNQETATTGTASFTSATSAESNVGTYAIDGSGLTANNGNYTFVQAADNATALTINPATLTYTATAANQTYGSSNTSFTGTVTGFVNGQNQETATTGTVSFTSTTSAESNVGSYAIDGSGLTANNGNYTFVQAAANAIALTINPATLTYTATAANQIYGSSNTSFTGTVTGFVNGQNQETATTGTASFTSATSAESNVGTYAIDGSGLTANNGNYTFVQAADNATALTINPATLTYTATAANQTYGSSNTSFTGTVTGFVNGQNQETATTGTVSFTSTTSAESNVGSYAIDGSGLTANNGNYTFVQAAANAIALTINPATLTYTATAANQIYGSSNTSFTGTVTGFVNGQNQETATTGTASFTSATSAESNVGTYAIDGSGLTANNGNYTFVQAAGNSTALTINPATLTYTATAANQTYGSSNTSFTGTVTGFVNGQNQETATTGTASFTSTTSAESNVGSYAIDGSGLTANNGNYTFVQAAGNATALTINPATLTYTATAANQTYGSNNTSFTGTVTGFVNGQNQESATTGTANFTSTTSAESNVGSYAIDGSGLTANNGNYTFVQAAGNATALTINPATLTYTATAANQTYGSSNTSFTGTVTGFVNGQNQETATTGTVSFTSTTSAESNVGSYAIDGSGLTANNGNYTFVQAAGNAIALTINPATLTYTATAANQTYGSSNTSFTGTVTGFVNGQNQETATTGTASFTSATSAESNVGTYAIDGSGLTANNGNYTFVQAVGNSTALTINPATLTYAANPVTIHLGQPIPPVTGTVTGFVNDQTVANATTGTLTFTTPVVPSSPGGSYAITGSGLTADNGNYVFVQAPGNPTAFTIKGYQFGLPGNPFVEFSAQSNANYNTFFTQSWFPLFDGSQDGWLVPVFSPGNVPHPVYSNRQPGYGGKEKKPKHTIGYGSSYQILSQTGTY